MARKLIRIVVFLLSFTAVLVISGKQEAFAGSDDQSGGGRRYDTKLFDRKIKKLPPGYPGHDIVKIYEGLAEAPSSVAEPKSAKSHPKKPKRQYPRELFALVCGQPTEGEAVKETTVRYDTDRRMMAVTFLPLTARSPSLMHRSIVVFREVSGPEETLETLDESGSTTVVKTYYEQHYGIASDGILHLSTDIYLGMAPRETRELRDRIGVLLVCRLKPMGDPPQLTRLESSLAGANATLPVETFYFQHLVGVELLEIWFYNKETGAVYLKKPMKNNQ
jgi:hypothetical protein